MRIVRTVSEAEVVAAFLRGELDSPRYGERLRGLLREDGIDPSVVSNPDVDNAEETAYRATLLDRHRGWLRREGLFDGLPQRINWSRAALSREEVLAIRYINWDWWLQLSGGSRLPVEAAARIRRNEIAGVTAEWHEPIAAALKSAEPPPELIAVAPPDHSRLVLLEGHLRLTAYALHPERLPDELEIFLGTTEKIELWSEF